MRMFERIKSPLLRVRAVRARNGAHQHPEFSSSASSSSAAFRLSRLRAVSWAALAAVLAGCDGSGSVVHSARLDARPDMQCMKAAVEKVPGVSRVSYLHVTQPDKQAFDEIAYHADDQRIMLMVEPDREYKQTFLRLGGMGADTITPRIRRVMSRVDLAVEKNCHIHNLSRKVRETCGDARHAEGKCPPLTG